MSDGFYVAAGVTSFDNKGDIIEDEDMGTLKFYLKYWYLEDDKVIFDFKEVPSRPC